MRGGRRRVARQLVVAPDPAYARPMATVRKGLVAVALLTAFAACGARTPLGADPPVPDGGAPDDYVPDTHVPPEAAPACSPAGVVCASSSACCTGLTCIDGGCGTLTSPSCFPNGASCMDDLECCNPPCRGGACGRAPFCLPGGLMCMVGTQCCSNVCGVAGVCTYPSCHTTLGATACDQCIVQSCCPLVQACEMETECSSYLQCVTSCEVQGVNAMACELQCSQLVDQAAGMVDDCAAQYCSSQCSEG